MIRCICLRAIVVITAAVTAKFSVSTSVICSIAIAERSRTVIHNKLFKLIVVAVVVDMSLEHSRDFCNRRISYLIILRFGKILINDTRRIVLAVRIITVFIVRSYAIHQAKTRSPYITTEC